MNACQSLGGSNRQQVMHQTRERVLRGNTRADGKLVSTEIPALRFIVGRPASRGGCRFPFVLPLRPYRRNYPQPLQRITFPLHLGPGAN